MALSDKIAKLEAATALLTRTKAAKDTLASAKNAQLDSLVADWKTLLNIADLSTVTAAGLKVKFPVLNDAECEELRKVLVRLDAFQVAIAAALANGELFNG